MHLAVFPWRWHPEGDIERKHGTVTSRVNSAFSSLNFSREMGQLEQVCSFEQQSAVMATWCNVIRTKKQCHGVAWYPQYRIRQVHNHELSRKNRVRIAMVYIRIFWRMSHSRGLFCCGSPPQFTRKSMAIYIWNHVKKIAETLCVHLQTSLHCSQLKPRYGFGFGNRCQSMDCSQNKIQPQQQTIFSPTLPKVQPQTGMQAMRDIHGFQKTRRNFMQKHAANMTMAKHETSADGRSDSRPHCHLLFILYFHWLVCFTNWNSTEGQAHSHAISIRWTLGVATT